jgi:uncharacterized protein
MNRKTNYPVVDCDGHIFEPIDLWEKWIDSRYKTAAPRVQRDWRGDQREYVEGRFYPIPYGPGAGLPHGWQGIAKVQQDDVRGGAYPRGYQDAEVAGFEPGARLEVMDKEGIDISLCYPTRGLYCINVEDPGLAAAICRAYNNWLYETWVKADPDRLIGVAMVPFWQDIDASIAEMERCKREFGFYGTCIRPNPPPGLTFASPEFHAFYAAAQDLGMTIGLHEGTGFSAAAGTERFDRFIINHCISHPFEQMIAMVTFILGGVLEKFPRLRVLFLESGASWAAYWLWRIDEHIEKRPDECADLKVSGTEYFQRQCVITTESDEHPVAGTARYIGEDNVAWSTDFFHWDAKYPGALEEMLHREDLNESFRVKLLGGNAIRIMGLEKQAQAVMRRRR